MNAKLHPLTNPYFLISLVSLVTNDLFLKDEYHNWLTGKISDFAGIFVFTYFFRVLLPNRSVIIGVSISLAFALWKSPYSQGFIDAFSNALFPINRIVDMSDLIALTAIPWACTVKLEGMPNARVASLPVGVLTILSFCATSVPRPSVRFEMPEYLLFKKLNVDVNQDYPNTLQSYTLDTLQVIAVEEIEVDSRVAFEDDYYHYTILKDLDLRFLRAVFGYRQHDLANYERIRDSLSVKGPTSLTISIHHTIDELNFLGTQLHGSFRRTAEDGAVLVNGRYRHGIPDSTWEFRNPESKAIIRRHFENGEEVWVEKLLEGKKSKSFIATRNNTIARSTFMLYAGGVLIALAIVVLIVIGKRTRSMNQISFSHFEKVGLVMSLPAFAFIAATIITRLLSNSQVDMFDQIFQFLTRYALMTPAWIVVLYWIRPRTYLELMLYLFTFSLMIVEFNEYRFLEAILI